MSNLNSNAAPAAYIKEADFAFSLDDGGARVILCQHRALETMSKELQWRADDGNARVLIGIASGKLGPIVGLSLVPKSAW